MMFYRIKKNIRILLISYCIINVILYFGEQGTLLLIWNIVALFLFGLFNPSLCFYAWIASASVIATQDDIIVGVCLGIVIISTFFYCLKNNTKISLNNSLMIILSIFLVIISYAFGIDSQILTGILLISAINMYIIVHVYLQKEESLGSIIFAFTISAFMLLIIVFGESLSGVNVFGETGRLRFSDNVRSLANAIVVPLFFYTYCFIGKKRMYFDSEKKMFSNIIFLILLIALLLTLSKGTIIAYIVGVIIMTFFMDEKKHFNIIFGIGIFLCALIILDDLGIIAVSRIFVNNEGLHGRTDIWTFYYDRVVEMGWKGILFGLGPGNVKRVAIGTYYGKYYAHSVVLDYFFSYGATGFTLLVGFLLLIAKKVLNSKNALAIGLFTTVLLMYSTHGASTNREFYILLGIASFFAQLHTSQQQVDRTQDIRNNFKRTLLKE